MAACARARDGSSPRGRVARAQVAGTLADSTHPEGRLQRVQARVVLQCHRSPLCSMCLSLWGHRLYSRLENQRKFNIFSINYKC